MASRAGASKTLDSLEAQIRELDQRFPHLSREDRFVLWFQIAGIVGSEEPASGSLTGGAKDKGIDAIFIDEAAKSVFITQGKYRGKSAKAESRNDVFALARIAQVTRSSAGQFKQFTDSLDELTRDKLHAVRDRVLKRHYRLVLYFVTTGKVASALEKEAANEARNHDAELEFYTGKAIAVLLKDYLEGIAPPVPSLELPIHPTTPLAHADRISGIDAWVVTASGEAVGELYEKAGLRIFARNVRGYIGDGKINDAIRDSVKHNPDQFWYLNNGVTIVCSGVRHQTTGGRSSLWIRSPQIINGQQTTRVLAAAGAQARQPSVIVKVISVPNEPEELYDELVSRIVLASNSQNQILNSDLISNDQHQVLLERELRNLGYLYIRKREFKGEARRRHAVRYLLPIKKDEFAQAAAATLYDPRVVRAGKERLFGEHYEEIFGHRGAIDLLSRYWLMRRVSAVGRGYPNRAYAKWLVLHFAWKEFAAKIQRSATFREACERPKRQADLLKPLDRAIEALFKAALDFFRQERGQGATALDISNFFYQKGRHTSFQKFWDHRGYGHRQRFDEQRDRFLELLGTTTATKVT
ncbi:MAG: AIPR family protein [Candidatus Dormibacteraeota bacterium]|nr:AIPR family protein [Candidatus Dormibacteraeota bacterium]